MSNPGIPIDIIDNQGHLRKLMPLNYQKPTPGRFKMYGAPGTPAPIPRSNWASVSLARFASPIYDQGQTNECNSFATCECCEGIAAMMGLPPFELSEGYLYGNINGQQDQGSMLEDAIAWMQNHGTCLKSTVGALVWRKNQWPPGAAVEAQSYRVTEWWLCPTVEDVVSAILDGFFVNIGIQWHQLDSQIGPNAVLPVNGGRVLGGHAICRDEVKLLPSGQVELWGPNSWGTSFGQNGRFGIPEARLRAEQGQYGWFAVREMVIATDPNLPPLAA